MLREKKKKKHDDKKEKNDYKKKSFNGNCYHCGKKELKIVISNKLKKRKIKKQKRLLMMTIMVIWCYVCSCQGIKKKK